MQIPRNHLLTFAFDSESSIQATSFPATGDLTGAYTTIRGKLHAVRMRFPDNQSWTLDSVRLRILEYVPGAGTPQSDDFLLYDTGLLENGEIPEGGTEAIDLSGDNFDSFWIDNLGEQAPVFGSGTYMDEDGNTLPLPGLLKFELSVEASGGSGEDTIVVAFDVVEFP